MFLSTSDYFIHSWLSAIPGVPFSSSPPLLSSSPFLSFLLSSPLPYTAQEGNQAWPKTYAHTLGSHVKWHPIAYIVHYF